MNNDLVYLNKRAQEERRAAHNCVHSTVREVHLELAQAYEFKMLLLKQLDARSGDPGAKTSTGHTAEQPIASPAIPLMPLPAV
jgi:hypothetical protein